jgi:dynactin-4
MWDPDAISSGTTKDQSTEDRQPEAGKVWERGRNWTTVVVEVVPGRLDKKTGSMAEDESKGADDDVLEIPVFVRVEWVVEVTAEDAAATGAAKGTKESREIAFWSVLGAGKITEL